MVCAKQPGQRGTGGGGGTVFDSGPNFSGVKRITVWCARFEGHANRQDLVHGIKLEFRDGNSFFRGGQKGAETVIDVGDDEAVTGVTVHGGWLVDGLEVFTSRRACGLVCRRGGEQHDEYRGGQLVGMFGAAGGVIDRAGFLFCGTPTPYEFNLELRVEYQQQAVKREYTHMRQIVSSQSTEDHFRQVKGSGGFSTNVYVEFDVGAKAAWDNVSSWTVKNADYREEVRTEEREFQAGFLQIYRVTTASVSINGNQKKTITREYVNSVPAAEALSQEDLRLRAEQHILTLVGAEKTPRLTLGNEGCVYRESRTAPLALLRNE
mmetsp:Transcript_21000/g.64857  ORF Transcript_21000/g.64857 Transcript_21000/m.64857 type:complete len:321 (-) Transcript_21000:522-1484(-)